MLLMGACIGRFWGLVAVRIATSAGLTAADLQSEEWAWIDPGVFAMVGAGAFMAGVSRLTLSLAVIVMEMTNEVHFLLPLLIAIMVAKWVADALEHALYHSLLEFKNVPFLPSEPFGGATLDMLSVRDIMCQGPVICVKEVRHASCAPRASAMQCVRGLLTHATPPRQMESLFTATDILRKTKFHAFPVIRPTSEGDVFVGMITREHLTVRERRALLTAFARASANRLTRACGTSVPTR
jgi:chloride channel 7